MFRAPSTPDLNAEQKAMHRAWLEETRSEYRDRKAMEKKQKEEDLEKEKERLKKEAIEEKSFKQYVRESKQRQSDIMKQINQNMVQYHEASKAQYLKEKRNPWGDNYFFEKMWKDKGVCLHKEETFPDY